MLGTGRGDPLYSAWGFGALRGKPTGGFPERAVPLARGIVFIWGYVYKGAPYFVHDSWAIAKCSVGPLGNL